LALYETDDTRAERRRRVLLTGTTGYIAGQLLPAFRERYDLRLIDVRETDASGNIVEGVEAFDLLSDEDSTLEPLFSDVDVVVHCLRRLGQRQKVLEHNQRQEGYPPRAH
jgi:nucleoside-diphosphate-sugar epimerase